MASTRVRRLGQRTGLVALALITLIGLAPSSAVAKHVQCGDTITQDTKLDSDLVDCPSASNGIVIGADGITLDLGGHVIDGLGAASRGVGIINSGFNRVQVRNGTVQQFSAGMRIQGDPLRNEGAAENIVSEMLLTDNWDDGVVLSGFGNGNVIERNLAINNGFAGISLSDSFGTALITKNVASGNGDATFGGGGIFLAETENARIEKNSASNNALTGIHVFDPGAVISHNLANDNYDLGIEAVPGVVDGGGNKAFGNGNPLQCLYVVCK